MATSLGTAMTLGTAMALGMAMSRRTVERRVRFSRERMCCTPTWRPPLGPRFLMRRHRRHRRLWRRRCLASSPGEEATALHGRALSMIPSRARAPQRWTTTTCATHRSCDSPRPCKRLRRGARPPRNEAGARRGSRPDAGGGQLRRESGARARERPALRLAALLALGVAPERTSRATTGTAGCTILRARRSESRDTSRSPPSART
mmetsp:Transcript_5124/g.20481  ORF Transcript_5124/g.20481 Transcript_5124/m.20481 type:complete len:205 (+) Transcript_5124:240-854(+)